MKKTLTKINKIQDDTRLYKIIQDWGTGFAQQATDVDGLIR